MPAKTPEDVHRLFVDAFNGGDVETLIALYEPEAMLCDTAGQTTVGLPAIRQAFQDFLASKPKIKLQTRYAIRKGDTSRCFAASGRLRASTAAASRLKRPSTAARRLSAASPAALGST